MGSYKKLCALPTGWVSGSVNERGFVEGGTAEAPVWSGKFEPPAIGSTIKVRVNSLGPAVVTGYFTEEGYLGVRCRLESPPKWWLEQNAERLAKGETDSHLFGLEIDLA